MFTFQVPLSLAMSSVSSAMTQQLSAYQQYQQQTQHPSGTSGVSIGRNSSIMCATAPTQPQHHHQSHHITVAHHQTNQVGFFCFSVSLGNK